ncbi:P-selectin-like [Argiope bruennichi]|uniref:P-selectin-like n=1 Tax=Argiope bruennichi TaxID=94029 RepID=UPI002494DA96|nr:P-selectin-like [Argiope bruennichi]
MKGAGFYNCTTTVDGTHCDITCGSRKEDDNRRNIPSFCHCQNGGTCLEERNCACPSGTTGRFCEIEIESNVTKICPDPGSIQFGYRVLINGIVSNFSKMYRNGHSFQYFCNKGYTLRGNKVLTCLTKGNWSSSLPRCQRSATVPVSCRYPEPMPNSRLITSINRNQTLPPRTELAYVCNDGYENRDPRIILCLNSGHWSSPPPTCNKTVSLDSTSSFCYHPGVNENAVIEDDNIVNLLGQKQVYLPGAELRYVCIDGYEMIGSSNIICIMDGKWTDIPPTCKRIHTITRVLCPDPGTVENGGVTVLDNPLNVSGLLSPKPFNATGYPVGTKLSYDCSHGYRLEGEDILNCLKNGNWSGHKPKCTEVAVKYSSTYCINSGFIPNGRVTVLRTLYTPFQFEEDDFELPVGTRLHYSCNEGYVLKGASDLICEDNGFWSEEKQPKCSEVKCDDFPPVLNGIVIVNFTSINKRPLATDEEDDFKYPVGTRLQYICDPGYTLFGKETLYCEPSGRWSAGRSMCVIGTPQLFCMLPETNMTGMFTEPLLDIKNREHIFPSGTEVRFYCEYGYELEGNDLIVCKLDGKWTSEPPRCKRSSKSEGILLEKHCPDPGAIKNGGVIVYFSDPNAIRLPISENYNATEYPVGTLLNYDCKHGYRMEGEKFLSCLKNGSWSGYKPKCIEDCGRSTLQTRRQVPYNKTVTSGDIPWNVFLYIKVTMQTCAGVLLDHRTVLTAAHCFENSENCTLYFGIYGRSNDNNDRYAAMRTRSVIITHPGFNSSTLENDIAIVKFSPDISYSPVILPICLPSLSSTATNVVPGQEGFITGWELNEDGLESSKLMLANLSIQTFETCPLASIGIAQGMFCAVSSDKNINICLGESGSPFIFYNNEMEHFVVEGLVSRGKSGRCHHPGNYTMFTQVSHYLQWINQNMKNKIN